MPVAILSVHVHLMECPHYAKQNVWCWVEQLSHTDFILLTTGQLWPSYFYWFLFILSILFHKLYWLFSLGFYWTHFNAVSHLGHDLIERWDFTFHQKANKWIKEQNAVTAAKALSQFVYNIMHCHVHIVWCSLKTVLFNNSIEINFMYVCVYGKHRIQLKMLYVLRIW